MDLTLQRTAFKAQGIFGEIYVRENNSTPKWLFFSLEHAYPVGPDHTSPDGEPTGWQAKIPKGIYRCVRGPHQLHNGLKFETFMVTGVPGHTGILFHVGNYNKDSEGCILIGKQTIPDGVGKSGDAFKEFMYLQRDCNEFTLEVV